MVSKWKIITIAGVVIAFAALWVSIQTNQASIDYWMEKKQTFTEGLGWFTVYCKNGGGMDGDFNLVLTFTNVTFSNQTELPYAVVDNSTVKFRYVLHKGESAQKTIYFSINQAESFSLALSLEKISFWDMLKPNGMYPNSLEYHWNEQEKNFAVIN